MIVRINETDFDESYWSIDNFADVALAQVPTDLSISEFNTQYLSDENTTFYIIEDEVITAQYNCLEITSITKAIINETDYLAIQVKVSTLSTNVEAFLRSKITSLENNYTNLQTALTNLSTEHDETRRRINQFTDQLTISTNNLMENYNGANSRFNDYDTQLSTIMAAINNLQDSLTAVQTELATIPSQQLEQLTVLDNRLNLIADRIAVLENQ